MRRYVSRRALAFGILGLLGTGTLAACWDSLFYTRAARFDSPTHRCHAISWQLKQWLPSSPGQGSDGPGRVDLYDTATGNRLDSEHVDIFNTLESPIWTGHTVIFNKFIELEAPAYCGQSETAAMAQSASAAAPMPSIAAPSPVAPVEVRLVALAEDAAGELAPIARVWSEPGAVAFESEVPTFAVGKVLTPCEKQVQVLEPDCFNCGKAYY